MIYEYSAPVEWNDNDMGKPKNSEKKPVAVSI
jgi:hypothetical protein